MIVFHTEATVAIGLGHAIRCLALPSKLNEPAIFLMEEAPVAFAARAAAAGVPIVLGSDAVELARSEGAEWVVLDGYRFDGDHQAALVNAGLRVLAFDDHAHAGHYAAHLVLNQNFGAASDAYRPHVGTHATAARSALRPAAARVLARARTAGA